MTRQPTSNTLQEHGLAGPPAYGQNQRRDDTHYDKGYEEANPWMQQEDDAGFSLAGNFPRTVRWRHKNHDTGSHDKVKPDQRGETDTAPQVQGAEDQANGNDDDEFEDDDELLDNEEAWLASLVNDAPALEGEAVDEDMEFEPGDLLGKVLALVNQVQYYLLIYDKY